MIFMIFEHEAFKGILISESRNLAKQLYTAFFYTPHTVHLYSTFTRRTPYIYNAQLYRTFTHRTPCIYRTLIPYIHTPHTVHLYRTFIQYIHTPYTVHL